VQEAAYPTLFQFLFWFANKGVQLMGKSDPLEKELYSIVLNYLHKAQRCITVSYDSKGEEIPFVNRGHGQLIVDVYGLRGIGDRRLRKVEGIAVEVKRKKSNMPRRYITQTEQYSHLAHRCYLAQPFDFTLKAKSEAARVGIGLLRIRGSKVELVSESRLFNPDADAFDSFLNRSLRIRQCAICGCYQFRYGHLVHGGTSGEGHWRRDHLAPRSPRKNKLTFLCAECEQHWASAGEMKKLIKQFAKLQKQVTKLRASIK
jgi:hypothetical protein